MSEITWTNTRVRLGDLKPWDQNPRMSSKAQARRLLQSFDKFGQVQTVAIDPDCNVLDGHQRLSALLTIHGDKYELDARQASRPFTDDERKQLVIGLHAGAVGSWDWQTMSGWDKSLVESWTNDGFLQEWYKEENNNANNLKEWMRSEAPTADADDSVEPADRFEEVAAKWGTAEGQLWKAGEHFIYCGDSLLPESFEIVLQGQIPALIEADPPYGVSIVASNVSVGGGESAKGMIPFGGVKNRRGTVGASKPFGSKAERGSDGAAHVVEVGKYPVIIGDEDTETAKKAIQLYLEKFPDAYHVWWGANYYVESVQPSPCWLVWNKETTGNFADCELAWTNAEMPAKLFTHRWNGMLRDSEREKRWHPTQKPAALAEWSYGLFTEPGDVVVDPFGGAGWTLLAAQQSNRKACVIEKSHQYTAVQLERLSIAFPALDIHRLDA
jgi:hypothetical protein